MLFVSSVRLDSIGAAAHLSLSDTLYVLVCGVRVCPASHRFSSNNYLFLFIFLVDSYL